MSITVASFNIEKTGQSSDEAKQMKVSAFVDTCTERGDTVIFLCEIHSARIEDFISHLREVYGGAYYVDAESGGYSNGYILMVRKDAQLLAGKTTLKGMTRQILLLHNESEMLALAHFKSGQTGLTKDQLEQAASALHEMGGINGKWAITGDMNWDYSKAKDLKLPGGSKWGTCWTDETQKSGGILDWCLAGNGTTITPQDLTKIFPSEMFDMAGPDHKPVIFHLDY